MGRAAGNRQGRRAANAARIQGEGVAGRAGRGGRAGNAAASRRMIEGMSRAAVPPKGGK